MNIRSQIAKSYQILHCIGAAAWLLCALVDAAVIYILIGRQGKNAWQLTLIIILTALACVLLCNAWAMFAQNFKSIEIRDHGDRIILKQPGRTLSLRPEEISEVRLEEKYLLFSFSTKPRSMLVIESPAGTWQVRSDILTSYDRVINYFTVTEQPRQ